MSEVTERDRRLAELTWAHAAAVEEAGAARALERIDDGPKPVRSAVRVAGSLLLAAAQRHQLGEVDAAVALWVRATQAYGRAHQIALAAEGVGVAANLVDRVLACAVVAGTGDVIDGVLAAHDLDEVTAPAVSAPRAAGLTPWGRVLYPLVAGADEALAAGVAAYRDAVPPGQERRVKALPALGEAALAVAAGDGDGVTGALGTVLAGQEHAVTRGHRRGSVAFCHEAAALWRLACDRGLEVAVDERYRAVVIPCVVAGELDLEGEPVRGERFRWPLDLLPIAFYERVLEARGHLPS